MVFAVFALIGNEKEPPITGHAVSDGGVAGAGEVEVTGSDSEKRTSECSDEVDNDKDNLIDMDDPDCASVDDNKESGTSGSGNDDTKDEQPKEEEPVEPEVVEEFCGDGICNADENCDTCDDDCECETIACMSDEDCDDGDDCTLEKCYFAGHPNAYCEDKIITTLNGRDGDGCCPEGATALTDWDCDPICGNGACEVGENERLCLEDCEHTGESGSSGGDEGGDEGPPRGDEGPVYT